MARFADFIKRSIARKLAVYIIGTGLVVASIAIVARLAISYQELVPELETNVDQILHSHLPHLNALLADNEIKSAHNTLARIVKHDHIKAVELDYTDAEGNPQQLRYPDLTLNNAHDIPLTRVSSITSARALIDYSDITHKLWVLLYENLMLIGLQAVLISMLLLIYMERIFARHLRAIAHYAQNLQLENLNEQFHYLQRKHPQAPDELDNLALAINRMRLKLTEDLRAREAIEKAWQLEKEEKLKTQRKILAAEAANRAKSQFIATMSHEIRTPMNGIIGVIDLLNHTHLDDKQKHYVDIIQRSSASLTNVINDILDYSKIEADKMKIENVRFDLDELLDDCVQLFSATTAQNTIELYVSIAPDTPTALVGDPLRLKQVLLNLMGNAFKFTREGYVRIHVAKAADGDINQAVLNFQVEDTGIGIGGDAQRHLFTAFNQADSSTTRRFGGTGLGLAISKKLVNLMGGEIGVSSELGRGATFFFSVNLTPTRQSRLNHPLNRRKLLLLSPDRLLTEAVQEYCDAWGMTLVHGLNANAIGHGFSGRVDWVMLDQHLPEPSTSLAKLQQLPGVHKAHSLLLSLSPSTTEAHPEGMDAVVARPLTRRKLEQALQLLLTPGALPSTSPSNRLNSLAHLKVLVAEDNPVNQMVIEGLLNQFDITPLLARNGIEAVAIAQSQELDLIVMDCEMPELDGFEATLQIRHWQSEHKLAPTPIIALTAHAESDHRRRAFQCGMNLYLSKPISLADLQLAFSELDLGNHNRQSLA